MSSENERLRILDLVESGQISAEEGVRLLKAFSAGTDQPDITAAGAGSPELLENNSAQLIIEGVEMPAGEAQVLVTPAPSSPEATDAYIATDVGSSEPDESPSRTLPTDASRWKRWWMIPLWIGVAITVSGGFLMYWTVENSGIGLAFLCAGVPFAIGLALLVLAWQSRTAPWLHLRVQQKPGEWPQRIAFSFPLPIRPTVWLLRTFGRNVKELEDVSLDEILLAVGNSTSPENPIYIQVDEGDQGEKVEIYIG